MALDLEGLTKAVDSLEQAVGVAQQEIRGAVTTPREDVIRAGVVQNFEFTYELCWKFMKRWLEDNADGATVDGLTRKELFRLAAENRLIDKVEPWFAYHRARNETVHTHDAGKAQSVYETALPFLKDARFLLESLRARND
jgi:nucleotidyltransferase substrate binding protein (TIGR01987 family)